jgi:sterol desaturase/sphingolipid hydroxylase (fatty acid hydroxylase superfamily)
MFGQQVETSVTTYWRFLGLTSLIIFIVLEFIIPFRQVLLSRWRRWVINFSMSLCNLIMVDQFFVRILMGAGLFSGKFQWNLYERLQLNSFWRITLTILALDFLMYVFHRLNHAVPFLWRFHRVHHTDLDVDVSSSARFHFGEVTISAFLTYAFMLTLGATIWEVRIFQIIFVLMTQFGHSNIRLWHPLENFLWLFLVPPPMHRIHHSDLRRETDSNYGTIFSFWDRIFRTFTPQAQGDIVYGLPEFKEPQQLTLPKLLILPFRGLRRESPSVKTYRASQN